MNNKIIIFFTTGLLFVSFIFLSYIEQRKQDINSQDWWGLYFENPKNESLNFAIENHSNNEFFKWEIFTDKIQAKNGEISIKKGETKIIPVTATDVANKKIIITVTDSENNKKEIYKSL